MKYIYVVLPRSETMIARIARTLTKYPYSHVTICLDDKLEVFYSFSRIYNNAPLISGYVKEYRSHLASKQGVNLTCKIFKIPVKNSEYKEILEFMRNIENDNTLMFNYLSMATLPIFHGFEVSNTYNCCAFVAMILEKISIIKLHKKAYKFFPKDFELLLDKYTYFEGELDANLVYDDDHYFDNIPIFENIKKSSYSMKETFYRFIFKKVSKKYDVEKRLIRR